MRRLIITLVLAAGAMALLPGCLTGDARHNAYHLQVLEADAQFMHQSWDWFWKFDRPTLLHLSHDYWEMTDRP